jgi:proline dehydrogenase
VSVDRAVLFRLATSSRLERVVRSLPRGEHYAWRAASRYVAGTTWADAVRTALELDKQGVASSVDQFGEHVGNARTADEAAAEYRRLADELPALPETVWLSVDLSHLGLDVDPQRCARHLTAIAAALPPGRRVQVGAEDHTRADAVLKNVLTAAEHGLADRIGATVQANLRRSSADLDRLVRAGVHIRLVKGAFVEPADQAFPYGEATDVAYLQLAHRLADAGAQFALATHDGVLREALLAALGPRPIEQLLGVRPTVLDDLTARGVPVRVYVPFGDSWFRYWMRRVAESRGV